MNRIFYAMVLVAFCTAAWRELTWVPPAPPPPPAAVVGLDSPDPQVAALAREVQALREAQVPEAPRVRSPMQALQDGLLDKAKGSVDLILGVVGSMAFFLGVMRVGEDAGLLHGISRAIRPLMRRLFPEVPADHPAMGAMILNLSANVLGVGNAATPFGIKAMQELDRLNPQPGTATNAMVRFLAINTSSVTLLPTGVIVLRETLGSENPAAILPTTLFATVCSTSVALLATAVLVRFWPAPSGPPRDPVAPSAASEAGWPEWASWACMGLVFLLVPVTLVWGELVASWFMPSLVAALLSYGAWRGVPVYESFVTGAREGWDTAIRILPNLVAILGVVGMLQASGALDLGVGLLDPFTRPLGLPGEALPMALLRPLSGSGALGVMLSTMGNPATGPDTYVGMLVSTFMGCTETTFYVIAVYFGAVGIQRMRHTLPAALLADLAGIVGSIVAVNLWFSLN